MSKRNAIEQRLALLREHWSTFVEDEKARLLRWTVLPDEVSMLQTFIEVEAGEGGELPDLFLSVDTPFETSEKYGGALLSTLAAQYEESREFLEGADIDAGWRCPAAAGEPGHIAFAKACESFRSHYRELASTLAVILQPEQISDVMDWQRWLLALLQSGLPPEVRVVVLDSVEQPQLEELCRAAPSLTMTIPAALNMPGAMDDLITKAGGDGPDVHFRRHLSALGNAAGKKDLDTARHSAMQALAIARGQGWHDMAVVVRMTLAGTMVQLSQFDEALREYDEAIAAAEHCREENHPAAAKLAVQCRFGKAAALLSKGDFQGAAALYEETVPLAEQASESMYTLESWRMAAYCHEATKQFADAWRCGEQALAIGEAMEEESRPRSTLPYVGQGLLRTAKKYTPDGGAEGRVRLKLEQLLGLDWEKAVEPGAVQQGGRRS